MTPVTLILIYPDTTRFIVGGFPSNEAANTWIENEKTKPDWVQGTVWEII